MKESRKCYLKYLGLCGVAGAIFSEVYNQGRKAGAIKTEEDIITGIAKHKSEGTGFYIMGADSGRMVKFKPR